MSLKNIKTIDELDEFIKKNPSMDPGVRQKRSEKRNLLIAQAARAAAESKEEENEGQVDDEEENDMEDIDIDVEDGQGRKAKSKGKRKKKQAREKKRNDENDNSRDDGMSMLADLDDRKGLQGFHVEDFENDEDDDDNENENEKRRQERIRRANVNNQRSKPGKKRGMNMLYGSAAATDAAIAAVTGKYERNEISHDRYLQLICALRGTSIENGSLGSRGGNAKKRRKKNRNSGGMVCSFVSFFYEIMLCRFAYFPLKIIFFYLFYYWLICWLMACTGVHIIIRKLIEPVSGNPNMET